MARYEVTKRPHYINGRIVKPGETVTLPEGVMPGKYLKEVAPKQAPQEPEAARSGKK